MEQGPCWEASSRYADQEILHVLWNEKDHHRIQKIPLIHTLNKNNSFFTLIFNFFNIILNISLCLLSDVFFQIPPSKNIY
jgi:hypothetical protein